MNEIGETLIIFKQMVENEREHGLKYASLQWKKAKVTGSFGTKIKTYFPIIKMEYKK